MFHYFSIHHYFLLLLADLFCLSFSACSFSVLFCGHFVEFLFIRIAFLLQYFIWHFPKCRNGLVKPSKCWIGLGKTSGPRFTFSSSAYFLVFLAVHCFAESCWLPLHFVFVSCYFLFWVSDTRKGRRLYESPRAVTRLTVYRPLRVLDFIKNL